MKPAMMSENNAAMNGARNAPAIRLVTLFNPSATKLWPTTEGSGTDAATCRRAARTGLGRAIVAQRVGELIERGLVDEGEVGPSTGGRPPRRISFRADAGYILVADLGATSIDVAVTDLDGRILGHRDEPADVSAGPERCLARIEELFTELTGATRKRSI